MSNCEIVRALFNEHCPSLPKLQDTKYWCEKRKNRARQLLAIHGVEGLTEIFRKIEQSDFLTGKNDRQRRFGFDWLIEPRNWSKVVEGNYDNRKPRAQQLPKPSYDLEKAKHDARYKPIKYEPKQKRA